MGTLRPECISGTVYKERAHVGNDLLRGRIAADVEAGMLAINGANVSAPDAPFGGVKWSGFGREDGAEGVMHCMVPKTIHES